MTSERQFAFFIKTSTDQRSQTLTSVQQALDLDDAGHEVRIYLDGAGTEWAEQLNAHPEDSVELYLGDAADRELIEGACGLCALNFDAVDDLRAAGIEMLGDGSEHSIDTARLADDGFELIMVT